MKSLNPTPGGPGIPNGETVTLVVRRRAAVTSWQEVVWSRVLALWGGMLRRKDQHAWSARRVLPAVSLALGVVLTGAACSSDSPPQAISTSVTFGSVPSQPEPAPDAVSAARDVIAQVRGLDQLQRRCVTLRVKADAALARSLAEADGPDASVRIPRDDYDGYWHNFESPFHSSVHGEGIQLEIPAGAVSGLNTRCV